MKNNKIYNFSMFSKEVVGVSLGVARGWVGGDGGCLGAPWGIDFQPFLTSFFQPIFNRKDSASADEGSLLTRAEQLRKEEWATRMGLRVGGFPEVNNPLTEWWNGFSLGVGGPTPFCTP